VTLVVDASLVVAGLTDSGADGRWAEALLAGDSLAAPHLMPVEAGNILRRAALAGDISVDVASLAHTDLLDLRVECFLYQPCAARVRELRENMTCYDGWYVAVAEIVHKPSPRKPSQQEACQAGGRESGGLPAQGGRRGGAG
jgi:predicted nucleic acid-binding protein